MPPITDANPFKWLNERLEKGEVPEFVNGVPVFKEVEADDPDLNEDDRGPRGSLPQTLAAKQMSGPSLPAEVSSPPKGNESQRRLKGHRASIVQAFHDEQRRKDLEKEENARIRRRASKWKGFDLR